MRRKTETSSRAKRRTYRPGATNAVGELAVQRLVDAAARRQRDEVLNGHARTLVRLHFDGLVHNDLLRLLLLDHDNGGLGCCCAGLSQVHADSCVRRLGRACCLSRRIDGIICARACGGGVEV